MGDYLKQQYMEKENAIRHHTNFYSKLQRILDDRLRIINNHKQIDKNILPKASN